MRIATLTAVAAFLSAACGDSNSPQSLCAGRGAAVTVTASDSLTFSPAYISITRGQSVCWENTGTIPHTVTDNATDGTIFNSNLPPGQAYVHTFPVSGSFGYHCNIHSSMGPATISVN